MNTIEQVTFEEIKACKFKPEPHTVQFIGHADEADTWYAYKVDGDIAACISVADKHGGKYIGSVYTDHPYRKRGIASKMIRFVSEYLFPNERCIAHALITSKKIFEECGFVHYKTVYYKHGTQYYVRRGGVQDGEKP